IGELLAAAVILHIFVILLSVTIGFALHEIFALPAWAALGIVTLLYLVVALIFVLIAVINFRKRQGLTRTTLTASRLWGILRGDIRPPEGGSVAVSTDDASSGPPTRSANGVRRRAGRPAGQCGRAWATSDGWRIGAAFPRRRRGGGPPGLVLP